MDFQLTKEQAMAQKMFQEFAQNEVKPLAQEVDEQERFPEETVKKMAKLGMMGIYFPKELGGAGGDVLTYAMAVEAPPVLSFPHTPRCAALPFLRMAPLSRSRSICLTC